jgi:hypothetical protein
MTKDKYNEIYPVLQFLDAWLLINKRTRLAAEESNLDLLENWLTSHNLPWDEASIIKAAIALEDSFTWHTPPVKVAEVLQNLPDGTRQLPLDGITEADLRKSSIAQIKDWERRKRAGHKYTLHPSFGQFSSKF